MLRDFGPATWTLLQVALDRLQLLRRSVVIVGLSTSLALGDPGSHHPRPPVSDELGTAQREPAWYLRHAHEGHEAVSGPHPEMRRRPRRACPD